MQNFPNNLSNGSYPPGYPPSTSYPPGYPPNYTSLSAPNSPRFGAHPHQQLIQTVPSAPAYPSALSVPAYPSAPSAPSVPSVPSAPAYPPGYPPSQIQTFSPTQMIPTAPPLYTPTNISP